MIGDGGPGLSTQLWIAARFIQVAVFLAAPLLAETRLRPGNVLLAQAGAIACALLAIFVFEIMPECFVPGQGLTAFKIGSEYAISLMAALACVLLMRRRRHLESGVYGLTLGGFALLVPQEMVFTLYDDPHGTLNALGHFIKILSFYLLYRAIIVTALKSPYD